MDLKKDNRELHVSPEEATGLSLVFQAVNDIHVSEFGNLVQREPTEEDRIAARELSSHLISAAHLHSRGVLRRIHLEASRFPAVMRVSELALQNTDAILRSACTPSIPDGFHHEWRGDVLRGLAAAADVNQLVYALVPQETAVAVV